MGIRFRKSFGNKYFRMNFSKSGIGYSAGVKGARYTKTAKGTTRTTVGIPNTGISHVSETSNSKRKTARNTAATAIPNAADHTGMSKGIRILLTFLSALIILASLLLLFLPETRVIAIIFLLFGGLLALVARKGKHSVKTF